MQDSSTLDSALDSAPRQPRPALRDLIALSKPRITAMVLLTTGGGLWLAPAKASTLTTVITLVGVGLIVSGANALNMFLERDLDGLMKRTKNRPLPTGRMTPRAALTFGLLTTGVAVPILGFGVNLTTAFLALLANILYVLAYTPLKQRSHYALQVGAVPGAIPPLLGWTAATGRIDAGGLVLFGILFLWQIPHFHAIALFRKLEYGRAGLVVLPNVEGDDATKHAIVRYTGALVVTSLLLALLHITHLGYLVAALGLGLAFLGAGVLGLRRTAGLRSARVTFAVSLVYLMGLFAAIAIDALVA